MAVCAKCGASLPSDGPGFCPACGAPVGAAAPAAFTPAATPAPAAGYGAAAPPAMAYATAPPQRSGGLLKVILIVIAVIVGLGILGGAAISYFAYKAVHNGAISVGNSNVSSSDIGVDPYPNSTPLPNQTVRMKLAGHQMVTAIYTTSDAPDAVVSYFKGKMGDNALVSQTAQGTAIQTGESGSSDHLIVSVQPDGANTKIVIVHTTGS